MTSSADLREIFVERAAILEYEGGHPRTIAERLASDEFGLPPPAPPRSPTAISSPRTSPSPRPAQGVTVHRWTGERADRDHDLDVREEPAAPPAPSSPLVVPGPSRCRSCKKPIVFAGTVGGKIAPFERDDGGEWTIDKGVARQVGKASAQLELGATRPSGPERYTSHFANCPDAKRWRAQNAKEDR